METEKRTQTQLRRSQEGRGAKPPDFEGVGNLKHGQKWYQIDHNKSSLSAGNVLPFLTSPGGVSLSFGRRIVWTRSCGATACQSTANPSEAPYTGARMSTPGAPGRSGIVEPS